MEKQMTFREILNRLHDIEETNPEALDQTARFVEPYDNYEVYEVDLYRSQTGINSCPSDDGGDEETIVEVPKGGYYFQ
jgi:hypothetical protein